MKFISNIKRYRLGRENGHIVVTSQFEKNFSPYWFFQNLLEPHINTAKIAATSYRATLEKRSPLHLRKPTEPGQPAAIRPRHGRLFRAHAHTHPRICSALAGRVRAACVHSFRRRSRAAVCRGKIGPRAADRRAARERCARSGAALQSRRRAREKSAAGALWESQTRSGRAAPIGLPGDAGDLRQRTLRGSLFNRLDRLMRCVLAL